MKAIVIIERGKDGTYSAYIENNQLPFGIIGDGNTVEETIEDFMNSKEEMKTYYTEENKLFPQELEFKFKFDVPSFLEYYSKVLSLAGLERLTGINQGQLSHYVTGHRKPSPKTVKKIESSIRKFGNEMSQIHFT